MVTAELPIEAPKHSHFMMIPNMAGDELDPFEFRLFAHYTRVCWQNAGECWQSVKTIHDATGISLGMITRSRKSLEAKGYIAVIMPDGKSRNRGESINVTIVDRWQENAARYGKVVSPDEQGSSQSEIAVSPHELADSPGETNKINKDIYTQVQEKKDKDKTDNESVANPELPDPEPVVLSVSEIPEQNPIIEFDIRALILPDTPLLPANVPEPPASIFVLEEIPSKHQAAAQSQSVPEVEYFHNDMLEEIDREIPGLKPGDKPLYKPDLAGALVMKTFETITGGTISPTISDLLNDGIKLRGAPAVIALIEKSVKADSRAGFVINSLKNWQNEKQPERRPPKEKPFEDIPWNDDGSLGSWQ